MSNNAGHPSSDAGYSNLELDLDDIRDIDSVTDGNRPITDAIDLTRGRMANGNGGPSSRARNRSSRQEGSRLTANHSSGGRLFGSDTEDEDAGPSNLATEGGEASSSRATESRTAANPIHNLRATRLIPVPPSAQGSSNEGPRTRFRYGLEAMNSRRRAVGLPELVPEAPPETSELRQRPHHDLRDIETIRARADARRRRREAMEQAIEAAPLPRSVRSIARERAEEAAAARRAAAADPEPNAAERAYRRRLYGDFREEDDREPPDEFTRPRYPWMRGLHDHLPPDQLARPSSAPASNFATQEEHRDALEAVRISRELDRQELADQRARAAADIARLRAEAPRNGIGAGGAGAWGLEQGGEGAANDGGWAGGAPGFGRLAGGLAAYLPAPLAIDPFGAGGFLGAEAPRFLNGIYQRNRANFPHAHVLPPSIEDAWKGCNYVGHRDPPRSGYTFDFDRENNEAGAEPTDIIRLDTDEDAPWTQELSRRGTEKQHHKPHLVCARCQVPLRVSEGMRNEDDRVYALRCGHVVDAKCLAEISKPKELVIEPDEVLGEEDIVGEGKTEDVADAGMMGLVEEDEGNDKPSARSRTRSSKRAVEAKDEHDGMNDTADTSIPTNKRKRGGASTTATNDTGHSTSTSTPAAVPPRPKPPKKPLRGRWGKNAVVPPEEYDWDCPVGEKCGRKYKSIKRGGVWMPDPSAAVQLFV